MEVEAEVSPLLRELWAAAVDGARGHIQMDSTTLPARGSGRRWMADDERRAGTPFWPRVPRVPRCPSPVPARGLRPGPCRVPGGDPSCDEEETARDPNPPELGELVGIVCPD